MGYIERCIDSVSFADEIIIVDSYSSDGTYEYLSRHPKVKAIRHPFQDFTQQKTFAMNQASNDWILFLDADEVVPIALRHEIIAVTQRPSPHVAYWFYRKFMFKNSRLRFSGWQTDKNYRLFRKSKVRFCPERKVHECLEIEGTSGTLGERLLHYSYKKYEDYKGKMLHYGRLKAQQCHENGNPAHPLKLIAAPFWKFLYNYTVRLGFLDGKKGLVICYLNALSDMERFKEFRRLTHEYRQMQKASLNTASD